MKVKDKEQAARGRKGGLATKKKYGANYYVELQKKRHGQKKGESKKTK